MILRSFWALLHVAGNAMAWCSQRPSSPGGPMPPIKERKVCNRARLVSEGSSWSRADRRRRARSAFWRCAVAAWCSLASAALFRSSPARCRSRAASSAARAASCAAKPFVKPRSSFRPNAQGGGGRSLIGVSTPQQMVAMRLPGQSVAPRQLRCWRLCPW